MRERINHLLLPVTLQGIQSSLLYLLSACEMCLSAANGRRAFYSQGETSAPKCNNCFYLERSFARRSAAAFVMASSSTCRLFWSFAVGMNEKCAEIFDWASSSELQGPLL